MNIKPHAREWRRRARHQGARWFDRTPKLLLLIYHRVLASVDHNPLDTIVSRATFARQLDAITRQFPVISLKDALAQAAGDAHAPVQAVLTFDDGYADNATIVLPELQRRGLSATFYIATESIDSGGPMWDWQLVTAVLHNPAQRVIQLNGTALEQRRQESRLQFAYRVLDAAKQTTRAAHHTALASCGATQDATRANDDRCMTWNEVRRLVASGMEIGAHSVTHRSLARLPATEAIDEIRESKRIIEAQVQQPCNHFAFPFGSARDFTDALIAEVGTAGFRSCALNVHGYNSWPGDRMQLRRVIMTEHTNPSYLLG